jgi:hypothetical protein
MRTQANLSWFTWLARLQKKDAGFPTWASVKKTYFSLVWGWSRTGVEPISIFNMT